LSLPEISCEPLHPHSLPTRRSSDLRNGKDNDLYSVDPRDPASDKLLTKVDGGGWFPLDWSPDNRRILLEEYVSINESYLWLVDADRKSTRLNSSHGSISYAVFCLKK